MDTSWMNDLNNLSSSLYLVMRPTEMRHSAKPYFNFYICIVPNTRNKAQKQGFFDPDNFRFYHEIDILTRISWHNLKLSAIGNPLFSCSEISFDRQFILNFLLSFYQVVLQGMKATDNVEIDDFKVTVGNCYDNEFPNNVNGMIQS